MKLDRNKNASGKGKYALINLRKINGFPRDAYSLAQAIIANPDCVEFGEVGSENEFFVLKLKDSHSTNALITYGDSFFTKDREFAEEIYDLANRSGKCNHYCKEPD